MDKNSEDPDKLDSTVFKLEYRPLLLIWINSNQPTSCCREAATTRVGCSYD